MLKAKIHPGILECGTDEAGRGCLAGPVTAAAVILPEGFTHPWLNDSKKLSKARRNELRPLIEKQAVAYRVIHIDVAQIDKINILNASILGMQQAVSGLEVKPEFIAVDGNRFKPLGDLPFECVIKGDAKYLHIAAASFWLKPIATNSWNYCTAIIPITTGKGIKATLPPNIVLRSERKGLLHIIAAALNYYPNN